jgi:hypothetical protein
MSEFRASHRQLGNYHFINIDSPLTPATAGSDQRHSWAEIRLFEPPFNFLGKMVTFWAKQPF